ncbi:MAG: GFA family protein [Puniceicoccales bacterium]
MIEGDFEAFFLCHCERCRKDTGSAHAANLFSPMAKLTWLAGADQWRTYTLPKTLHQKSFCCKCGSALPSVQDGGKMIVVPAGSLDTDVPLRPHAHICLDDRANWDQELECIARLNDLPSSQTGKDK